MQTREWLDRHRAERPAVGSEYGCPYAEQSDRGDLLRKRRAKSTERSQSESVWDVRARGQNTKSAERSQSESVWDVRAYDRQAKSAERSHIADRNFRSPLAHPKSEITSRPSSTTPDALFTKRSHLQSNSTANLSVRRTYERFRRSVGSPGTDPKVVEIASLCSLGVRPVR
jgi:hypothetical protein